jgi:hypothetical protein
MKGDDLPENEPAIRKAPFGCGSITRRGRFSEIRSQLHFPATADQSWSIGKDLAYDQG